MSLHLVVVVGLHRGHELDEGGDDAVASDGRAVRVIGDGNVTQRGDHLRLALNGHLRVYEKREHTGVVRVRVGVRGLGEGEGGQGDAVEWVGVGLVRAALCPPCALSPRCRLCVGG
jgi:hypothetical protein